MRLHDDRAPVFVAASSCRERAWGEFDRCEVEHKMWTTPHPSRAHRTTASTTSLQQMAILLLNEKWGLYNVLTRSRKGLAEREVHDPSWSRLATTNLPRRTKSALSTVPVSTCGGKLSVPPSDQTVTEYEMR